MATRQVKRYPLYPINTPAGDVCSVDLPTGATVRAILSVNGISLWAEIAPSTVTTVKRHFYVLGDNQNFDPVPKRLRYVASVSLGTLLLHFYEGTAP